MKSLMALLFVAMTLGVSPGQNCPNGRCPYPPAPAIVWPAAVSSVGVGVTCERFETDPETFWRFKMDGREVGTLDEADGMFQSVDGKRWRFALPVAGKASADDREPNFVAGQIPPGGVDHDKIAPGGDGGFYCNGRRCDKRTAFQSLLGGASVSGLPDDSGLLRLTVIGPDADRARVLNDVKNSAALADLRASFVLTDYPPDHWAVAGLGFKTDGKPTVYIQAPNGKVIHRQDNYDGPERLAGAVRRAKDYDPTKDKDLRDEPTPKPPPVPVPSPAPSPVPAEPSPAPVTPTPTPAPIQIPQGGFVLAILAILAYFADKLFKKS